MIVAVFKKTYTLNVSATPSGSGTVTPGGGVYDSGSGVILYAAPSSAEWRFDRWEGVNSGKEDSATVEMDSDKNITAYFSRVEYRFTTSINPSGSGSVTPDAGSVVAGGQIILNAIPSPGWEFDHWGGDVSGINTAVIVPMTSNKNVTAYFTQVTRSLPTTGNLPTSSGTTKSTEQITRNYSWNYRTIWDWEMNIPVSLYDYYRKLPRPPTVDYSVYVTHPLDDPYIDMLVAKIREASRQESFSESETVEFATSFIQSLPYTVDSVTTPFDEYPRYPVETLVDYGGDCEDTSILLATILDKMGYGVVLLELPDHMAVGLKGGNINGTYWEYLGNKYYYIETTGENWGVGVLPDEYKNAPATILPLIPVPILVDDFTVEGTGSLAEADVKVTNLGTAPAQNVVILAGFDAGGGIVWNSQQSQPFTLEIGQETTVKLNLRIPAGKHTRLLVQIILDGVAVDESYTDWFDT